MMRWLPTIKQVDGGTLTRREDGARRDRLPAAHRRARGARGRLASSSRSARRPTSRCSTASPGIEVEDGVVQVGPNMMTGHAGIFAGGDMVPAERTVTVGDRPRQEGRRATSTAGCAARASSRRPSTSSPASTSSTPGTTPTRPRPIQPALEIARRAVHLRRGGRRPRRVERALRGAALHVLRQLLLLRQLLRRLPRQRGDQARPKRRRPERQRLRDRPRLLQGLRPLRRGVPLRRDRDGPREDLTGSSNAPDSPDRLRRHSRRRGRARTWPADQRDPRCEATRRNDHLPAAGRRGCQRVRQGGADLLRAIVRQGSRASRRPRRSSRRCWSTTRRQQGSTS